MRKALFDLWVTPKGLVNKQEEEFTLELITVNFLFLFQGWWEAEENSEQTKKQTSRKEIKKIFVRK